MDFCLEFIINDVANESIEKMSRNKAFFIIESRSLAEYF